MRKQDSVIISYIWILFSNIRINWFIIKPQFIAIKCHPERKRTVGRRPKGLKLKDIIKHKGESFKTNPLLFRMQQTVALSIPLIGYHSTTVTFITTSVLGRSPVEVSTFCIASTTSSPSSTSPNTVYPPSRKGVPPCVV